MNGSINNDINRLLDELIGLLDKHPQVIKLDEIKSKIDKKTLELIDNYRCNPTVLNKKKLYENKVFREYVNIESDINYLIMEINNKFKLGRGKCCESNKW